MNKIGVVGVYFGELPEYFELWLKSCVYNANVDFHIITDNKPKENWGGKNIFWHNATLAAIKVKAEKALNQSIKLEKPYKMCDLKPMYGVIFQDILCNYDYWGHCDFDMIFGDLKKYFDSLQLYKYQKFLPLGHLSLYKNTDENNYRYMLDGGKFSYKTVLSSKTTLAFDEMSSIGKVFQKYCNQGFYRERPFADISEVHQRFSVIKEFPETSKMEDYEHQLFYWKNGCVYRSYYLNGNMHEEEFMYIHFQKRKKMNVHFDINDICEFYITSKGFFEKNNKVSLAEIEKYNPYLGEKIERNESKKYRIQYLLRRVNRVVSNPLLYMGLNERRDNA